MAPGKENELMFQGNKFDIATKALGLKPIEEGQYWGKEFEMPEKPSKFRKKRETRETREKRE